MEEYGRIWYFFDNGEPRGEPIIVKRATRQQLVPSAEGFCKTFGGSALILYGTEQWIVKPNN